MSRDRFCRAGRRPLFRGLRPRRRLRIRRDPGRRGRDHRVRPPLRPAGHACRPRAGGARPFWRADRQRLAYRGDDDAAARRQFSAEGGEPRLARHRRIALAAAGAAGRRAAHSGLGSRSDAVAIKTRPRHGAHPGRGAEPERRSRHEPEGDEHHRAAGALREGRHRLGLALQPRGACCRRWTFSAMSTS